MSSILKALWSQKPEIGGVQQAIVQYLCEKRMNSKKINKQTKCERRNSTDLKEVNEEDSILEL
jgi:hypothetical protein